MKKYILLIIVLINSHTIYAQNNDEINSQTKNQQEIKEDPNAKFRTDTVSFTVTTSLLGPVFFLKHH